MKVKYKMKDNFKVEGKGVKGFIVLLTEDGRPDPERFDKVYAKLLSMKYHGFTGSRDRRSTGIALGVGLSPGPGRILWADDKCWDESLWLIFTYDTFMSRNITVEVHES